MPRPPRIGVRPHRRIAVGDEAAFPIRPSRSAAVAPAARRVLPRAIVWPRSAAPPTRPAPRAAAVSALAAGFVGSLAHDEVFAVAAAARAADIAALGVDVEPAEPLPPTSPKSRCSTRSGARCTRAALGRAIFAAKEAVYKAINPLDGSALEYEDIEVDFAAASRGCATAGPCDWRVLS